MTQDARWRVKRRSSRAQAQKINRQRGREGESESRLVGNGGGEGLFDVCWAIYTRGECEEGMDEEEEGW